MLGSVSEAEDAVRKTWPRRYGARMISVRPGYDWGKRSEHWTGVTSQVADIGGVRVHYLRTDAAGAARDALPHLLVHPLGAGSWWWMDVIRPLAVSGWCSTATRWAPW